MSPEKGPEKPRKMTPEEILKSSNHIEEIIYRTPELLEYDHEPIEVIFKNTLSSTALLKEMKKHLDSAMLGYLKAPIIIDDFTDDRDRNELENNTADLTEAGSVFYKSNRLRITNIRNILSLADTLTFLDVISPESKDTIKAQIKNVWSAVADMSDEIKRQDNFEKYDKLSIQEKIIATDEVAKLAREVCVAIIESQKK